MLLNAAVAEWEYQQSSETTTQNAVIDLLKTTTSGVEEYEIHHLRR